jgi:DNA ligase-1
MRIGTVQGLVELAIAEAFGHNPADVRRAMLVADDIAQVAELAKNNLLVTAQVRPLTPLSFMLADVMFSAQEIEQYYRKPLICEFKYDGMRLQLHKAGDKIRLFSRRLEDTTASFPELVQAATSLTTDVIFDGEVLAWSDGHPLHFQVLQKRLHRKSVTKELEEEAPVVYIPYDVLYLNGEQLIHLPLRGRIFFTRWNSHIQWCK